MYYKLTLPALLVLSTTLSCTNNGKQPADDNMKASKKYITILDQEASKIIDDTSTIEIIAQGYTWTEGPVYVEKENFLLFSEIPSNKIYKWKEGEGTTLYLSPSGYTGTEPLEKEPGSNGLLIDHNGDLVICQHGNRQIARMQAPLTNPAPQFETIASHYNGKKLNSPNDIVQASNGDFYFTDPPYGLEKGLDDPGRELNFQGVYCIKSDGKIYLVTDKIKFPNGITLSPDNKFLYVANSDSENRLWMRYELNDSGLVKNESIFYKVSQEEKMEGSPDGMKMSRNGYLFASGPGGVWIFNPAGNVIARIYTGEPTSNCFLDEKNKMLYMTCASYVMRVKIK